MNRVTKKLQRRCRLNFWFLDHDPEDKPELWANGSELRGWRKRKVELEATRQQKDPVNRCAGRKIEQLNRVELLDERASPVREDLGSRRIVGNRESQVEIRPTISFRDRQGTDNRASDDACVPAASSRTRSRTRSRSFTVNMAGS